MRYCKKCLMPDTRPNIWFNDKGLCGGCVADQEMQRIDWNARWRELEEVVEWAKKKAYEKNSNYDCAIGVSGGKDSTFQAVTAKETLGLRALLVNSEPDGLTEIGRHNIENLINLGFDVIKVHPNPQVMKALMKKVFYEYLNLAKITEYSLWSSAYIIAGAFDIPLIIQGENPVMAVGSDLEVGNDGDALKASRQDTLLTDWRDFASDQISEKDLFLFHYDEHDLRKKEIRGIWLGYYAKEWSQPHNMRFSTNRGLKVREKFEPEDIGTYAGYYQMDSDMVQVNQMLKYIKFGFGQCLEHACYDIREGNLSRKEAIELVRKYDGKCAERYVKKVCDYMGIDVDEFWKVANSFRGPMWEKNSHGDWVLKDPVWEQE